MLEEIVRCGEENLLRAIPLGVAVDSHYEPTIPQFSGESNPIKRLGDKRVRTLTRRFANGVSISPGGEFQPPHMKLETVQEGWLNVAE